MGVYNAIIKVTTTTTALDTGRPYTVSLLLWIYKSLCRKPVTGSDEFRAFQRPKSRYICSILRDPKSDPFAFTKYHQSRHHSVQSDPEEALETQCLYSMQNFL